MAKTEQKQKIDTINAKLDALNRKLKSSAELAVNKTYETKDNLAERVKEAKEDVSKLQSKYNRNVERLRDRFSDELSIVAAKRALVQEKIDAKLEEKDAKKLANYIDEMIDYSDGCVELSLLFAAEAKLAALEALLAMEEYDSLYAKDEGEEEDD